LDPSTIDSPSNELQSCSNDRSCRSYLSARGKCITRWNWFRPGWGKERCPHDLDTIADLQKVPDLLKKRGYGDQDIANMMHGNWLRFLRRVWK
jgi:microsomal dipeptidase-like Zn-dependent dipeptidase